MNQHTQEENMEIRGRKKGLAKEWMGMSRFGRIALIAFCAIGVVMAVIGKIVPPKEEAIVPQEPVTEIAQEETVEEVTEAVVEEIPLEDQYINYNVCHRYFRLHIAPDAVYDVYNADTQEHFGTYELRDGQVWRVDTETAMEVIPGVPQDGAVEFPIEDITSEPQVNILIKATLADGTELEKQCTWQSAELCPPIEATLTDGILEIEPVEANGDYLLYTVCIYELHNGIMRQNYTIHSEGNVIDLKAYAADYGYTYEDCEYEVHIFRNGIYSDNTAYLIP